MLQHTLIVGTTGSGKSYTEHLIIDKIISEKFGTLILVDPKKMELCDYDGAPSTLQYADNATDIHSALIHAYDLMMIRFSEMKKKHQKTCEEPPVYVFVDEMGALMNDHKHRKQYGEILGDITMMGRAARVFAVLCTQIPTRENLPNSIRDNMVNKVCLRLDDVSRAHFILGNGANDIYEQLPKIGYGYVKTPDMYQPEKISIDDVCEKLDV